MKHALPSILLLLVLTGCSDIIEADLTDLTVSLLTPQDRDTVSTNVVTFRWTEVPDAETYRIQIATPDLVAPELFLTDSVVSTPTVTFAMAPGAYEWRVRAQNSSSHTEYAVRRLVVVAATSLEDLTPILIAPTANAHLMEADVALEWEPLPGAQDHRLEVRETDQNGPLVLVQVITGGSATLSAWPEGIYVWGIQGQNNNSVSAFSYRTFTVDRTPPTAPLLIAPANNAGLPNTTFTFQWQSGTDLNGTRDTLIVADANQVEVRRIGVAATSWPDSLGTGTYQWSVRTTDEAGNGTTSTLRTLTIQ